MTAVLGSQARVATLRRPQLSEADHLAQGLIGRPTGCLT